MKKTLIVICVVIIASIAGTIGKQFMKLLIKANSETTEITHNNYNKFKDINLDIMTIKIPDNWEIKNFKEINNNLYDKYLKETKQRINNSEYYTQEEKKQVENNVSNIDIILFASSDNLIESIIITALPNIMLNDIQELLKFTNIDIKDNYDELKNHFEEVARITNKYPTIIKDIDTGTLDGKKYFYTKEIQTINQKLKMEGNKYIFLIGKIPIQVILMMTNPNETTNQIEEEILKSIKFNN